MLEGERGSGKSAILKVLAEKCKREPVILHMGEQIDGKVRVSGLGDRDA